MLEAAKFFVESFNNLDRIHLREYRCPGQRKRCRVMRLSFDWDFSPSPIAVERRAVRAA
jgi:hypothetical protein